MERSFCGLDREAVRLGADYERELILRYIKKLRRQAAYGDWDWLDILDIIESDIANGVHTRL